MKRFEAAGWAAARVDGHDPAAIAAALAKAQASDQPALIACKTIIGFGAPTKAGTVAAHGSPLGADEIAGAREKLGWTVAAVRDSRPTSSPPGARPAQRGKRAHAEWSKRLAALDAGKRAEFERRMTGDLPHRRSPTRSRAVKADARRRRRKTSPRARPRESRSRA